MPGAGQPAFDGGCTSCGDGNRIDYTMRQTPRVLKQPGAESGPAPKPVLQAAKPIQSSQR